jgi:hypothetical protein
MTKEDDSWATKQLNKVYDHLEKDGLKVESISDSEVAHGYYDSQVIPDHTADIDLGDSKNELLESAWVLIANANEGNWDKATRDWQKAAIRWRDRYRAEIKRLVGKNPPEKKGMLSASEKEGSSATGVK